jgi:hypothetical protein
MAKQPAFIHKEIKLPESKDYAFLKRTGIDYSQELSGEIWTDYNHHDPGVTILEQLCFALTELAYKAGISVEELLYAKRPETFDSQDNAFFIGERIFPSAPLTSLDYRQILVDYLYPDVKNAWLKPLESGAFGVDMGGLFQVNLITNKAGDEENEEIRRKAMRLLSSFRNVGEDVEELRILKPLRIAIKLGLEIDPKFLVEGVISSALLEIKKAILPTVRFLSRDEMEEKGMSFDEIYSGPLPKHGFVDLNSLKESGNEASWSIMQSMRIASKIKEVKGVDRITELEIGFYINQPEIPDGFHLVERFKGEEEHAGYYLTSRAEKLPRGHRVKKLKNARRELELMFYSLREEDPIPDGYYPELDLDTVLDYKLVTASVDGLYYDYNSDSVRKAMERISATQVDQYQHELKLLEHAPKARRTAKELEYYYSVQYSFPEIYGIGQYGVSKNRPLEWRLHAKHLKGYLFFYEQILADYQSQLTNFYKLFSLKDHVDRTYFHQVPEIPNRENILRGNQSEDDLQEALETVGKVFDPVTDRRNRALDHLLARFGEEFLAESYHAIMRTAIEETPEKYEHELIKAKLRFLENVIELGRDRGKGLDYMDFRGGSNPQDFVTHSSALQKRMALLFNMKDHQHLSLTESIREAKGVAFGKKKAKPEEGQGVFTFNAAHNDVLAIVFKEGLSRGSFTVKENGKKKGEFQIFFSGMAGKGASDPIFTADSREKCEAGITSLIRRLRELNADSEGFHLVEHVLFRPVGSIMHTWYLVQDGRIYLESPVMERDDYDADFKTAILRRGDDAENYVTTGSPAEGYTLVLTDEDGSIIAYKEGYVDENSAERERDRLVLLIPNLGDDDETGVTIRKEQHIPKGALLADDFYSLKVTVILPSWPVRFRNDKFRNLFEQVLKLNVPAHTETNCYWLDLAELADFEKIYLEWRAEKAKPKPKQPWLDELSWCLVILLKLFQDPHDTLVLKELPILRDKHGLSMKFGNE